MGLWDWLGPTSLTKRRGWDALPAVPAERKSVPAGPATFMVSGASAFWTPTSAAVPLSSAAAGSNSAVFACLQALATAIAEPELRVYRLAPGERIELEATPLGLLLARPCNRFFSMDALLGYASTCLHVDGNAYWRKIRAGNPETGNVLELWPLAPGDVEPVTRNGSADFISFYRFTGTDGRVTDIQTANVVHFRYGIDDADHRRGLSPLKRLLREISSDEQATRYADRLLANLAINGLTLSFDKEAPSIDQATADELKARIQSAYGGDNAGAAAVLSPGATLTALGFSPEQMDMKTLHRVPEERISAVLGVPAIVAGLGAGLDRSTYSNYREARETFTEQKLIPLWRQLASEITLQLAPDFTSDRSIVVDFDISDVRALADDENAAAERLKILVEAGIITTDEARAELGLESRPAQEVPAPVALPAAAASRRGVRLYPFGGDGAGAAAVVPEGLNGDLYGELLEDARQSSRALRQRSDARATAGSAVGQQVPAGPALTAGLPIRYTGHPNHARSVAVKAAEDLVPRYEDLREASLPAWEAELATFLAQQLRRVNRRLRAGADTAEDLVTEGEAVLLGDTLEPLQLRLLGQVSRLVVAELGVQFTVPNPMVEEMLRSAGVEITSITETTRSAVQDALVAGQQAGEGVDAIARRLRELPAFDAPRARVIANTELGRTMNESALISYRSSGIVTSIRVHDGDYDTACESMNGRVFPLDQAPAALEHPSCRRAFSPVVADEVTRSA